jgi:hypothetical protein
LTARNKPKKDRLPLNIRTYKLQRLNLPCIFFSHLNKSDHLYYVLYRTLTVLNIIYLNFKKLLIIYTYIFSTLYVYYTQLRISFLRTDRLHVVITQEQEISADQIPLPSPVPAGKSIDIIMYQGIDYREFGRFIHMYKNTSFMVLH